MRGRDIVICMAAFAAGMAAGRFSAGEPREVLKVEKWTDTVVVRQPEVMVVRSVRTDTVTLPVAGDSVDEAVVAVPIEQREYQGDGYRAWVSGYRQSLDSLVIERQTVRYSAPPTRRWSVGVQAGVGLTPKGVQPYVGVGVTIRL